MGRSTCQVVVQGTALRPSDPERVYREKLARITLDSMIQLVGLLDAEGTVLEINKAALDAVGLQLSEVEGKPFWMTCWWQVSEAINLELRESIRRAAAGELVRWDTEIYGRSGGEETVRIEASLRPVVDAEGRVVFLCAEGRDITEKKAQEREIAQKNLELQALRQRIHELDEKEARFFANVSHELRAPLALILGPAPRLLDGASPLGARREAAQVVAGNAQTPLKPAQERMVARPRVLVVVDDPDMNRFVAQCLERDYEVATAVDGREGLAQARRLLPSLIVSDLRMPNVSGVEMTAELRQLPALQLTPILLLSAKADDEQLVQLLDHGAQDYLVKPFSERELRVRVKNLVQAQQARVQMSLLRDAAESAHRAKDEFLAMLGHELRNPLSPILSALQLMALRGDEGSERERVIIERQVNHLSGLVEDLLDISRITRGGVELKMAPVELSDVVGRALEMVSPLVEERRHTLRVAVPAGLWLEGDRQRLAQVVSHLLTNAAKYTAPGGEVAVVAEAVAGPGGGAELSLVVRDTGIGIAPDMLPRIFEMFVQERQEIDRTRGGLGIGLAIVRNLVERHGGAVSAHSEGLGKGAELRLRLPALSAASSSALRQEGAVSSSLMSAGALTAAHLGAPPGSTRDSDVVRIAALRDRHQPAPRASRVQRGVRVLVVDDNEDAAEMLGAMLIRRGYDAAVANDAKAALQLAADAAPDVAILDIGLPVVDGYALAGQLLAMPGLAGLQLIALTGYGQESDRQRTRAAGFHHHLVKPVSLDTIEAVLPPRAGRGR